MINYSNHSYKYYFIICFISIRNALSEEDSVTEIERKQEEVVSRLRHEEVKTDFLPWL